MTTPKAVLDWCEHLRSRAYGQAVNCTDYVLAIDAWRGSRETYEYLSALAARHALHSELYWERWALLVQSLGRRREIVDASGGAK